jgi:hypothetical protein
MMALAESLILLASVSSLGEWGGPLPQGSPHLPRSRAPSYLHGRELWGQLSLGIRGGQAEGERAPE